MATNPPRVHFAPRGAFSRDLEQSTNAYFDGIAEGRRDVPRMYVKSALVLAWFVASWVVLVFVASTWLQGLAAAVSLGLSIAVVGMCVQHDANHGATSNHGWVNKAFSVALDIMGASSLVWRPKHNVAHHTFTNVVGVDYDLDFGILARLSPEQPRRAWHRFQHVYLWGLYGFLLPKWVFFDDWVVFGTRRVGVHPWTRPRGWKLLAFVGWKLFFLGWAFVIPALFHPFGHVLLFHAIATFTLGVTLGTMFQLAHCTSEAEFPAQPADGATMKAEWTAHQLETCVNFAPRNRVVSWFVGGLNYQVEHHLFPKVCHVHYPALSPIVAAVAARHGLKYRVKPTLWSALVAHVGHLRALGKPVVGAIVPAQATTPTPQTIPSISTMSEA